MPQRLPQGARVLLVRTDRLGDVLLSLPMISAIKKNRPDIMVTMMLKRYTGAIASDYPGLDGIVWVDNPDGPKPWLSLLKEIRGFRFAAVIVGHPRFHLAALFYAARIPMRVGSGYRWYSWLFTHRIFEHRKDARRHEVEYNLNLLAPLDCSHPGKPEIVVHVRPEAAARVGEVLRASGVSGAFVVLHPGSGGSARDWSAERFGELATLLCREGKWSVIVTGSAGERALAESVCRAAEGCAHNMAGAFTLPELAALVKQAAVTVANSTGPLHLAAAVGTPVVGLYPPHPAMSRERWGPYTSASRVLVGRGPEDCMECVGKTPGQCVCMNAISAEAVRSAVHDLLRGVREFHDT